MGAGYPVGFRYGMLAVAAVSGLAVCGCTAELTFRKREALDYFVGKDRAALLAQLGQPTTIGQRNGNEYIAYDVHFKHWYPGEPGVRNAEGIPISPWVAQDSCVTTFRLAGGVVNAWSVDGSGCRDAQFPPLGTNIASAMNQAATSGVDPLATYVHDSFTDRSVVVKGEFNSH